MPHKQALSNECHSHVLDNDALTMHMITNTVVSADHDVPFIQATIKELQMYLTLAVSPRIRPLSGYTRCNIPFVFFLFFLFLCHEYEVHLGF